VGVLRCFDAAVKEYLMDAWRERTRLLQEAEMISGANREAADGASPGLRL
jgi:hypothetical protein